MSTPFPKIAKGSPSPRRATKPKVTSESERPSEPPNLGNDSDVPRFTLPEMEKPEPVKQRVSLEDKLAEFLGSASIPFALAGDMYCAQIIATRTPALATALAELARENPAIRRVLNRVLEGSAWGGVAIAVVGIALPIAQHHNLVPGFDPFAAMYPPVEPPRRMAWEMPPASSEADKATSPSNGRTDVPDEYKTTVPGAPPGVVTVAATSAGHGTR